MPDISGRSRQDKPIGAELSWHSFSAGLAFGFLPAGITVSALLLTDRRRWPVVLAAIVVGKVGVDLQHHLTFWVASGSAAANRPGRGCAGRGHRQLAEQGRPGLVLQWWAGDGIAVLVIGGPVLLWSQQRVLVSSREECLKPVDLPGRGCTFPDHPEQALKQGRRANAGREGTPGAYSNP